MDAGSSQPETPATSGTRALRESEERFRQLADAMPQIVWVAGPDGAIEYVNNRWFEYMGGRYCPAAG